MGNLTSPQENDPLAEVAVEPLGKVFEHAAPGLAIFDLNGRVVDCNAAFARLVGRGREELLGMDSAIFVHPEDRERSQEELPRLLSGELSAFVIEKRLIHPDSSEVWVRNSVTLLRDAADRPKCIVTISEDMTFCRRAETALMKNEKLASVGRLSASIAHELNNPLESVTNLLYLITHGKDLEEVRRLSLIAEQEMRRVAQIATQTLRYYRQQSVPGPLQVADVIDSVLALFEGRLRNRVQIVKRYQPCEDLPGAYSGELRQVFVNLIGNALDAMGDKGVLLLGIRPSRHWREATAPGIRVIVCDSGSGIPSHMVKKIFEPFVSTKENHGTGLGLWISRDIVRRHGGVLSVRSSVSGPRRGTAMSVFLPIARANEAVLAA